MSAHMKKHPIKARSHGNDLIISDHRRTYVIPKTIANRYIVEPAEVKKSKTSKTLKTMLNQLDDKFTKAGALLKGLRLREGLTQMQFAKKISVTQSNLSNMENGRRPIGKSIAKRIEKIFGTDYRYFLE